MIPALEELIEFLRLFPGIGEKSARRMAFYLLKLSPDKLDTFAESVLAVKSITKCPRCGMFTQEDLCEYCRSSHRERSTICVVEEVQDVQAIEQTGIYKGLYHILGGHISPVDGIFLPDLNISSLFERIDASVREIIIATNPTLEGEATANYLIEQLRSFPVKITRLATGLPIGGDLSILSPITVRNSLQNRKDQ
ncbi:MAG TPA: recombination mediator RecR [Candidatus Mcinerneyibacteriales bacterium]|nr:recombination mediator RecR [Candidatus Mcinerneyibacteriales bacterium]